MFHKIANDQVYVNIINLIITLFLITQLFWFRPVFIYLGETKQDIDFLFIFQDLVSCES